MFSFPYSPIFCKPECSIQIQKKHRLYRYFAVCVFKHHRIIEEEGIYTCSSKKKVLKYTPNFGMVFLDESILEIMH